MNCAKQNSPFQRHRFFTAVIVIGIAFLFSDPVQAAPTETSSVSPTVPSAKPLKVQLKDLFENTDVYLGKLVQVEGRFYPPPKKWKESNRRWIGQLITRSDSYITEGDYSLWISGLFQKEGPARRRGHNAFRVTGYLMAGDWPVSSTAPPGAGFKPTYEFRVSSGPESYKK